MVYLVKKVCLDTYVVKKVYRDVLVETRIDKSAEKLTLIIVW